MAYRKITIQWHSASKRYYIRFTKDGKRVCEYFTKKEDAKIRVGELKDAGVENVLTNEEKRDYFATVQMLKSEGVEKTVSQIVAEYLSGTARYCVKNKLIADAVGDFLAHKEKIGRRAKTLEDLYYRMSVFARSFGGKMTCELSQDDIEKFCANPKWSPRSCRNYFCGVQSFLRWCFRRKYVDFEPNFDPSAFLPKELKKAKTVFSADEIERLFSAICGNAVWKKFAPFYAVQAFCGLRAEEAKRLQTSNINFENRTIMLPAEIVKTGEDFTLRDLPENLWQWLELARGKSWQVASVYYFREIAKVAGEWKHNGLRHTFATMHVSLHQNPAKTSLILRHRNQQRLWQNYLANPVAKEEAERYFAIVPAGTVE